MLEPHRLRSCRCDRPDPQASLWASRDLPAPQPPNRLGIEPQALPSYENAESEPRRATHDEVQFRYLAAGRDPDHDTIAAFRQTHLEELAQLFVQLLSLCQEAGLIQFGQVAIDGTKAAASASARQSAGYAKLTEPERRFATEVRKLLKEARRGRLRGHEVSARAARRRVAGGTGDGATATGVHPRRQA